MTEKIELPGHILSRVRAAERFGHFLYSQGAGMFRCKYCDHRAFLDGSTAFFDTKPLTQKPCPQRKPPAEVEPSPWR